MVEAWPGRKRRKGQRGKRLRVGAEGGSASTAGAMMAPSCNITPKGGPKVTEAEEVSGDARPGRSGAAGDMGGGEEGPSEGDGNNDKEGGGEGSEGRLGQMTSRSSRRKTRFRRIWMR